jgi:hypothetical protein
MNRMFPTSGRLIRKSNECTFGSWLRSFLAFRRGMRAPRRDRNSSYSITGFSKILPSPSSFASDQVRRRHLPILRYVPPIYHHIHPSRPNPSPKNRSISQSVRYAPSSRHIPFFKALLSFAYNSPGGPYYHTHIPFIVFGFCFLDLPFLDVLS